jgi:hypothetical protein
MARSGRVLVGIDIAGVARAMFPVDVARLLGVFLQHRKDALPQSEAIEALEAVKAGLIGSILGRNVCPTRSGA